jgi:hypothetical protein
MAHFYIYGDESGKLAISDFTSFCGYVGHAEEFSRVMSEWDTCRFSWEAPPIHMRLVMNPERDKSGEWERLRAKSGKGWEGRRDAMLMDFSTILDDSRLACVGCVVDSNHFRKMPSSPWRDNMQDPLFLGLYTLIMNSLDKIDRVDKKSTVSLVVDDDPQYAKDCYDLLDALKTKFPRVNDRVTAITFGDDSAYPALQMADMIAFEARSLMVKRLSAPDYAATGLYTALTKRQIHQPTFWSAEYLDRAAVIP